jgi:hypothetical protein
MKLILPWSFLLSVAARLCAQDLKMPASKEIDKENYGEAVWYLQQAVPSNPDDAMMRSLLDSSPHRT